MLRLSKALKNPSSGQISARFILSKRNNCCRRTIATMPDNRPVFFFDIDNCLYPKSKKVHDHMSELIDQYFIKHLSLSRDEAYDLHQRYYKDYGLAIEGLVRHHKIDPLEYNRQVDDALPLESILVPDPDLRSLLEGIDKSKVKMWLFTNAYITHGQRVVKLLEVDDLFEGITYCDYGADTLLCKPDERMFAKAMREAGIKNFQNCFFVDDSAINCKKAQEIGWNVAHLVEEGVTAPVPQVAKHQIKTLRELTSVFPQLFKST